MTDEVIKVKSFSPENGHIVFDDAQSALARVLTTGTTLVPIPGLMTGNGIPCIYLYTTQAGEPIEMTYPVIDPDMFPAVFDNLITVLGFYIGENNARSMLYDEVFVEMTFTEDMRGTWATSFTLMAEFTDIQNMFFKHKLG